MKLIGLWIAMAITMAALSFIVSIAINISSRVMAATAGSALAVARDMLTNGLLTWQDLCFLFLIGT